MDFKVKGHSSYRLKLNNGLVTKSAESDDLRLMKSAGKQKEFTSKFFKSPLIHSINNDSFVMNYIEGHSFIEFLTYANKRDIDNLLNRIQGYFKERIKGETEVSIDVFKQKVTDIGFSDKFHKWEWPKKVTVYEGTCHGDMTFSNMIFSNEIYLIDFLDSYLESPTMDLIKLRQDTHLHWSLLMTDKKYDKTKIKIALKYIDDYLISNFNIQNYKFLQKINLLRILPYAKDIVVSNFVNNAINRL